MIYVTGDIHGELYRFCDECMPGESSWTNEDKLIVCGDFGFVWYNGNDYAGKRVENDKLDNLASRPYQILFADGNHENFNEIYKYPIVEIYGGKAHKIRDNIYHLIRGEVYDIECKSIFVMGGAYSIDKYMRQKDVSWWEQENPNDAEYKNAIAHIEKSNFKVDYIISHTAPSEIIRMMKYIPDSHDIELTGFFDWVMYETDFKRWYFGHWHTDKTFELKYKNKCFRALFNDVCKIDEFL